MSQNKLHLKFSNNKKRIKNLLIDFGSGHNIIIVFLDNF